MDEYEAQCKKLQKLADDLTDANFHQESRIIKDVIKEVLNADSDPTARILKMLLRRNYEQ